MARKPPRVPNIADLWGGYARKTSGLVEIPACRTGPFFCAQTQFEQSV
jgi:hypothetical protein